MYLPCDVCHRGPTVRSSRSCLNPAVSIFTLAGSAGTIVYGLILVAMLVSFAVGIARRRRAPAKSAFPGSLLVLAAGAVLFGFASAESSAFDVHLMLAQAPVQPSPGDYYEWQAIYHGQLWLAGSVALVGVCLALVVLIVPRRAHRVS